MHRPENVGAPLAPLDRLDESTLVTVHDHSMEILESVGIQLQHEAARELLCSHGATVDDAGVVTVPRAVVESAVADAPATFDLHGRTPGRTVTVGGDGPPVRAPGYGPDTVRTAAGGRRPSDLDDYETLLKLAQTAEAITCTGYSLCEPRDVPETDKHVELLARALRLTDQPLMGPTYGADRARTCLDMVGIAVGDRDLGAPYVAGLINTVPPRRIGREMLGGLLTYAEAGQPLVVSSFTKAGASGPPTLAGSLALTNAENLLGIALAQLANPGTPVVYGVPTATVDGRYGSLSIGTPESALFAAFAGQMGRFYDVPSRGGGGLTDGKRVDFQSGLESTLVQTVTAMAGVDFVVHAAGILEAYSTVSPEKFVLDCETLRYLDRFAAGVDVGREDFRLDRIAAVEPGGHFVAAQPSDDGFTRSAVVDKRSFAAWAEHGSKGTEELAAERVSQLLDAYEEPTLPDARASELDAYVADATGGG